MQRLTPPLPELHDWSDHRVSRQGFSNTRASHFSFSHPLSMVALLPVVHRPPGSAVPRNSSPGISSKLYYYEISQ